MKTEKALLIVFIISLIFKLMHWPGGGPLMVLSLTFLAFCYFPFGFYFFSDKTFKNQKIGVSILFGWLLSVAIIGIEFKLMFWPGSKVMLLVGCMSAAILLLAGFSLFKKSNEDLKNYYKNLLTRTVVIFVFATICLILPNSVLINHYYSNEPELRELYLKQQENPEDENIQMEIQAYKAKQYEQENGRQRK
ncbi:GldL-related protein [Flavobacterium lacisediminis]|uniref:Gliding motility protein GldL-like N-terminal domain-containing protein n=1 Tax=Flavobacterium lacisediminis TaxID=2989705 RepID=A0ABT3EJ98_9FLAO|nr:hypothetical protein [Flavobacterium lacisediminis]MCW1148654.1 hypothetical protein [Flavobacterium lacisediminis]